MTIWVQDEGVGIPEADLDRILDSFVQGDSPDSRGAEGVGLGLSIAKTLVELHDGTLSVTSSPDVGTRFMIDLPLGPSTTSADVA